MNERGCETLHELFYGVGFQEDGLLQRAEELLVGRRVLDGPKIKLSAGPYDELRGVARTDGDCQADKITAVSERTPCAVMTVKNQ